MDEGVDLEHCLFRCVDKERVSERSRMNVEGLIATTGEFEVSEPSNLDFRRMF